MTLLGAGDPGEPAVGAGIFGDRFLGTPEQGIRARTARGSIINAAFLAGLNLLGLLKGFVVAGFLTTDEYGVWGLLIVSLVTLLALGQLGFSDKYIQQDDPDPEAAFQRAFTLQAMVAAGFVALVLVAMPLYALAYGTWEIVLPAYALALVAPGLALQTPLWIFQRRMNFLKQRTLQAFDPVVGFVATTAFAVAGLGYWALVLGALLGSWAASIAAVRASPYPFAFRIDSRTLRAYLSFSWPLFVQAACGILIAQVPLLIVQRSLGLEAVGAIGLAGSIAFYATRVDEILMDTLYPAICAVKDRADVLREAFIKSNRLAVLWGFPFGVGMALFGSDIVEFGLGDRWRIAVPLIQAFGLIAAADQILYNWTVFYRARGDTRPIAVHSVVATVSVLGIAAPLLVLHGLGGFALGMGVTTALLVATRVYFVMRMFPAFTTLSHTLRAIVPTVPGAVIVLLLKGLGETTAATALLQAAGYILIVVGATTVLERSLLRELLGYLRGRPATAVPAP